MHDRIAAAFDEACAALGIRADDAARDDLIARWSEPHRHYHDLSHLDACLRLFGEHRGLAERPGEVIAALLFHDAIYDPTRTDNEAQSAARARRVLAGAPQEAVDRIARAIEATKTHEAGGDPDVALVSTSICRSSAPSPTCTTRSSARFAWSTRTCPMRSSERGVARSWSASMRAARSISSPSSASASRHPRTRTSRARSTRSLSGSTRRTR